MVVYKVLGSVLLVECSTDGYSCLMKYTFQKTIYSVLIFLLTLCSCVDNNRSSEEIDLSQETEKSNFKNDSYRSEPSSSNQIDDINIEGVYSGTDNVGMESTIVLRSSGRMIVQPSVGDGTPSIGRWIGTSDDLSLYVETDQPFYDKNGQLRMGGDQLLGNAVVTKSGLQIIGGNFYSRK